MKRLISIFLVMVLLLTGCAVLPDNDATTPSTDTTKPTTTSQTAFVDEAMPNFTGLNDPSLLSYLEDTVYAELVADLNSEPYFVENVQSVYISKEYLEEVAYNSQENIYFGYTLSHLNEYFQGTRYVFTLGDNGHTIVAEFQEYDDTYDQILKNVAIGTGVILLCVTISTISAGVGAPAVSMIFAASAKNGAIMGLSSGVFSGVAAGVATGIQTGDFNQSLKAAALAGSEGFMWGAISGAISGGTTEAVALKGATLNGLTMNEAALIQKQSGYPLDVIKQFSSMEQYQICQSAGLSPRMVNGNMALIRSIDLDFVDDMGRTNLQRMKQGLAALDPAGNAYELHHIGQHADSTLAILTKAEHMQGGNNLIWHTLGESTEVHAPGNTWNTQRQQFWKQLAYIMTGEV